MPTLRRTKCAGRAVVENTRAICSVGNAGPTPGSVTNVAPWVVTGVVTVGANTINREFPSYATTKDDEVFFVSLRN